MKHFTIDAENNITVHASRKAARETDAGVFATEEQFADLIGPDNKRLIEIWNSLPGVKPVTKFTSRKTATERIWKAIQSLGETVPAAKRPSPLRHKRLTSRRRRLPRRPGPSGRRKPTWPPRQPPGRARGARPAA